MSGSITFSPTPADWIAANRLWYSRSRQRRWLRWTGYLAIALVLLLVATDALVLHERAWLALADAAPALLFATLVLGLPRLTIALIPRQVRRQFAQRPGMTDESRYRWTDEGLEGFTRTGTTVQPWSELHRQLRDGTSFVFLMTDNMLLLIPRRALTAEQDLDLAQTADRLGPPIR